MNLLTDLHQFHLLRPQLLWLLLPAALLCWALARTTLNGSQLQKIVDPDLLPHLILRGGAKRPWLFALIFALLASAIIALAGPSWRKLPTPVYSNQDALVILLDLSPSMMATDLSPNRLTRARLKILDILRQRKDGLTALVAYAGEAHVVTPLTEDTATIANLVPALTPSIMPLSGSNIEMAVQTGLRLLKDGANGRGQLLAITDDVDRTATVPLARSVAQANVALNILAVGSGEGSPIPRGDTGGFVTDSKGAIIIAKYNARELAKLARDSGGRFAEISVNDSDTSRLLPQNEAPEEAQLTEREFDQWREEGPWLILLLLPFAALLFRRGALACALPFSLGALLMLPAQQSKAFEWQDLWRRDDQQARQMLEEGETEKAAKTFKNPQWRGTANYRAGDFPAAAEDFSHSTGAQGLYNLGNSLTQQGRYDEAISAYDEALKQQPQLADAAHNRDIAKKLKELQQQQQQQNQQQSGDSEQQSDNEQQSQDQQQQQDQQQDQQKGEQQNSGSQSDQSQDQQSSDQQPQDGEQKDQEQQQQAEQQQGEEEEQKGQGQQQDQQKEAGAEESPLDPETQQALDQWLRQIPDDPAGLMREKFKYESLQRRRAYRSGDWQPPENGASQRW